jgi:hypothetical protein
MIFMRLIVVYSVNRTTQWTICDWMGRNLLHLVLGSNFGLESSYPDSDCFVASLIISSSKFWDDILKEATTALYPCGPGNFESGVGGQVDCFWTTDPSPRTAVSRASGYGLDKRGVKSSSLTRSRIFSSSSRPDRFWAHPASYPMGTGGSFPWSKAAGAWSWPPPPSSAEVKKAWVDTSTPPYSFMV